MPGSEVSLTELQEGRRRWAIEIATRVFSQMEQGTKFVTLAKEIEDYAKEGKIPEDEKE